MSASSTTGVSCSRIFGGRSRAIGEIGISSSSTSHVNNCCTARNLTLAVAGERTASRWVMKSETCPRVTAPTVVTPASARCATSWSADST
jgi:hypothetical protein